MTNIAEMNEKRIYIGGGLYSQQTFEYLDVIKNEWISLANTNNAHQKWPIIWNENENIVHIASTVKSKYFEKIDIRENKWLDYIKDDDFDKLFGRKINSNEQFARLIMSHNHY